MTLVKLAADTYDTLFLEKVPHIQKLDVTRRRKSSV
jgi:hypothetical protein